MTTLLMYFRVLVNVMHDNYVMQLIYWLIHLCIALVGDTLTIFDMV